MTKEEIIANACEIENYIKEHIVDFNVTDNILTESIQHCVRQLENRSKEYHHPSFVVLVVGPVKSGKSTFVNLVAKNYVSPTDFLECTVRPSIISKKEGEGYLEVYESLDTDHKEEQMDDILDFLNGLIEKSEIKNVNVDQREFSRDNIDKYVKRSMVEVKKDQTLLTAIHTEGGKLLQDNVLLVDMAGFDGANVNFESPAYKAIVERADLIIFVQSSNSAISKVSSDFFELLKSTNSSVPVCLVHNVFEAAFWRSDKRKQLDIEAQKKHAIDVIRDIYKLTLETNNAFNLNLGKVNDLREKNYEEKDEPVLSTEAKEFEKAEEDMYRLFERRECIRLKNCITRTKIHKEKLLKAITNLSKEQEMLLEKYNGIQGQFDNLKREENDILLASNVSASLDELKMKIEQVYYDIKDSDIIHDHRYRTNEARGIVQKFLNKVENEMNEYLHLKQDETCTIRTCNEFLDWLASINNTALKYGIAGITGVNCHTTIKNITYNLDTSVEKVVRMKPWAYRHTADEVNDYLNIFKNKLLGFTPDHTTVMVPGYVERIYVEIQKFINESIINAKSSIISFINDEIENIKSRALNQVIPDIESFNNNNNVLNELKQNVEKLNINIP